jgi:hypothetical protein
MKHLTMFTFGYWGWGNATEQLVRLVDAVEQSRGFRPPRFADIRISRSVRAPGFNGNRFEDVVGEARYRWLKSLGNKRITTKRGPRIQIADPKGAVELLDYALSAWEERRRVIFFCSCEYPCWNSKSNCHRVTAAKLVAREAAKRGVPIELCEWPGPGLREIAVDLDDTVMRKSLKNNSAIPLGAEVDLAVFGLLGIGTLATLRSARQVDYRVVDRMIWKNHQWQLPILESFEDGDATKTDYRSAAKEWQRKVDFVMKGVS